MFTIVKLGGVNGSGKTSVAREILKWSNAQPATWAGTRKSPNHYVGDYNGVEVLVLGSYETTCGGMDTISDKYERLEFVQWAVKSAAKRSIIFFEGLITGKTYGALGALSEEHVRTGKGQWLYAFMDTPFNVCADRVLQRRQAAGNHNPFDPERTMRSTFTSCQHLAEKLTGKREGRDGPIMQHTVLMLDHKRKPVTLAERMLKKAVEMLDARR